MSPKSRSIYLVHLESIYQEAISLLKMEKGYIMLSCSHIFNTFYHMRQRILRMKGERSLLTKKSMHLGRYIIYLRETHCYCQFIFLSSEFIHSV